MTSKPDGDDEPVPRLPRSAGFKLSMAAFVRIAMTAALLVMILVARRPCADSVSGFVTDFDKTGSAGDQMPKPGRLDVTTETGSAGDYETLRPDMTEAEIKAAIARAKARAAASGSAGTATSGSDATNGSGATSESATTNGSGATSENATTRGSGATSESATTRGSDASSGSGSN